MHQYCTAVQEMTASISAILAALSFAAHQLVWKLRILVTIFTPSAHAYQIRHQPSFCGGDCGEARSYDFFSLLPHPFFYLPSMIPTLSFSINSPLLPIPNLLLSPLFSSLPLLHLLHMLLSFSRCSFLEVL